MITTPTTSVHPSTTIDLSPSDHSPGDLVSWAAELGIVLAEHAARNDEQGAWVSDSYRHLVDAGALALAVPSELGGLGAPVAGVARFVRELARHCGSTALAMAMHQHATLALAWRYRRGQPGAEAALRGIVDARTVLATAGGSDFTSPSGSATAVDGGYRVSGRKRFVSQSVAATVLSALFPLGLDGDRQVISVTIPMDDPGLTIEPTWNAMGMRGTASNEVTIDDVFVPEDRVGPLRPYGVLDPPLQLVGIFALPVIAAVYLGIAESAHAAAVERASGAGDVLTQRSVGVMAIKLRVAGWALDGALAVIGDDPDPSMEIFAAAVAAKHHVATTGIEVCDLAMEVVGGAAFARGCVIERAYRDVRAAKFHPLTPDLALLHAGRLALGVPCDEL